MLNDAYFCKLCEAHHMRGWSCSYDPGPGATKLNPHHEALNSDVDELNKCPKDNAHYFNTGTTWILDKITVVCYPGHRWNELPAYVGDYSSRRPPAYQFFLLK